jgi:ATP-dependent Clp protease ATP-binding subunit ClpA
VQRRLADAGLTIDLTPAAKRLIAAEGHDPAYGARPLKRSIQRLIENPLARALLENRFSPGTAIKLDADAAGTTLLFTSEAGEAVVASTSERRDARARREEPVPTPAASGERLN